MTSLAFGGMDTRVSSLQRNIDFLQKQHGETLGKLHNEIEHLKRENKELQFKLIMETPKSNCKTSSHRTHRRQTESQKYQTDRRNYLEQTLEDTHLPQNTDLRWGSHVKCRDARSNSSEAPAEVRTEGSPDPKAGFITSLQPLMIQCIPSQRPRPPTLHECEVIIRQLYNANSLQSQEILRVKAVLKDIVLNKKITAENYILTKAYLTDGKSRNEDSKTFPQLSLQTLPREVPVSQASKAEKVILPALKQSLNNNIAERHRRTQAVQRRRLQRTVH